MSAVTVVPHSRRVKSVMTYNRSHNFAYYYSTFREKIILDTYYKLIVDKISFGIIVTETTR